jgi:hypothetical protein
MTKFPSLIIFEDPLNDIPNYKINLEFIPRVGDFLDLYVRRLEDIYRVTEVHIRYTDTGVVNKVTIYAKSFNNT